jgi:hypothetical protein
LASVERVPELLPAMITSRPQPIHHLHVLLVRMIDLWGSSGGSPGVSPR